jgi:hypothetical protein
MALSVKRFAQTGEGAVGVICLVADMTGPPVQGAWKPQTHYL